MIENKVLLLVTEDGHEIYRNSDTSWFYVHTQNPSIKGSEYVDLYGDGLEPDTYAYKYFVDRGKRDEWIINNANLYSLNDILAQFPKEMANTIRMTFNKTG